MPKTTPVPNFPDNAVPALGDHASQATASNLNYVAVSSPAPTPAQVTSPAPGPTGTAATSVPAASVNPPTNPPAQSGSESAGAAPNSAANGSAADLKLAQSEGFVIDGNNAAVAGTATSAAQVDSSTASAAATPGGTNGQGGTRQAKVGTGGVAVPSANGPLDVFVVDGGINVRGKRAGANNNSAPSTRGN